ncbi:Peptidoglycan O-acetyltransferase [Campylobacter majalis]|uniref:Peptidoglycan O-acetyltransferase n=1 Tax=Campylobacter majalis TaxID=2790656 RepID=A0ABM8Q3G4_9BACT|nr:Peptidoglycan O-acetyltransferase [Campylobacter majalis]
MIFNFLLSKKLISSQNSPNKRKILIFGISANLALLGYFKYADFFIDNLNFALNSDISRLNLLLPLAISFFTFQQIAYLVYMSSGGGAPL